jgi:hypothetical protein
MKGIFSDLAIWDGISHLQDAVKHLEHLKLSNNHLLTKLLNSTWLSIFVMMPFLYLTNDILL